MRNGVERRGGSGRGTVAEQGSDLLVNIFPCRTLERDGSPAGCWYVDGLRVQKGTHGHPAVIAHVVGSARGTDGRGIGIGFEAPLDGNLRFGVLRELARAAAEDGRGGAGTNGAFVSGLRAMGNFVEVFARTGAPPYLGAVGEAVGVVVASPPDEASLRAADRVRGADMWTRVDENMISQYIKQRIEQVQHRFDICGFEFVRKAILETPHGKRPKILGRIDLKVKFAGQLGRYREYLGVESKRVAADRPALARYYVTTGVGKFASGLYCEGHPCGLIVGYVIRPSGNALRPRLSGLIRRNFPGSGRLTTYARRYRHATVVEAVVPRLGTSPIRLIHALVRMHA